jgi:hypothetical protein
MTQAQVIITKSHVYVTGYSPYGATILFKEVHGKEPFEEVVQYGSEVLNRAYTTAYRYQNRPLIREDATEQEVLDGKFNNLFI